ncbi:MAG: hypothetical protein IPK99_12530 [Flavobacteriales bacterium]|nr:hypothetical protein [Flavobacteriales bacterium]
MNCSAPDAVKMFLTDNECQYDCVHVDLVVTEPPAVPQIDLSLHVNGSSATLTVDATLPASLSYPQEIIIDIPAGLQMNGGANIQCGSQSTAQLTNGDVIWTIADANDPCTLVIVVGYSDPLDQASYVVSAGPEGGCCTKEVIFQGEQGPCNATATLESSGSACSGPYQVDCIILPYAGEQPINDNTGLAFPAFTGGMGELTFGNGQGVLIQHLQGTISITGKLHQANSSNVWWIQLYLNNASAGGNPDWLYYELDPGLPSLFSLYDGDEVHDIAALPATDPERWSQMGMGANLFNSGDGLFGKFLVDVGGSWLPIEMHLERNCTYDWVFSECSGKITVVPGLGLAEPYEVSITTGSPVFEVDHQIGLYGTYNMLNACSGPHAVTVTDANGCVWNGDVTVPGSTPMDGEIVYTHDACEDGGSAMAVDVTGGTPFNGNYTVTWHPINRRPRRMSYRPD